VIKKYAIKTWMEIGFIIIITLFIARPWIEKGLNRITIFDTKDYEIDFVDDSGYRIRMKKPADSVISLYSAHTENLFAIGADREVIGVGTHSIYPYEVLLKEKYDYRSDPEKVIAIHPDVVIIRPFIERHSPDFVNSLRRSGITVVSLYPDNFDEFDDYIMKLAKIVGKENTAKKKLEGFHKELDNLKVKNIDENKRVGVYFESSDREYKTITNNSMPAYAIELAGGINIATDAIPIEEGSSIAAYGVEKILEKADEIDVYVTQRGVMGAGGNYHSISIRPGFYAIKAVRNKRILEINQKIISSPTFRFIKGVKQLRRTFYPEIYDEIQEFDEDHLITREEFAKILVKLNHDVIFIPTSSYYRDDNKEHYYGALVDVTIEHESFDYIETAIRKSYLKSEIIDNEEYFNPEKYVTREELARVIYLLNDLENKIDIIINDEENIENIKIVKTIVSNKLMDLENGKFYPKRNITFEELKKGLDL